MHRKLALVLTVLAIVAGSASEARRRRRPLRCPVPALHGPAIPVTAYVTNSGSGTVTPIRTATSTAAIPVAVGSDPGAIAITPDGTTAYVTNSVRGR